MVVAKLIAVSQLSQSRYVTRFDNDVAVRPSGFQLSWIVGLLCFGNQI